MSAKSIRAGAAFIELYTKDNALVRGLDRAQKRLTAFGASVQQIGTRLAAVGTAAMAPLLGAVKVFTDMGDAVGKMATRTGISVESLSELRFAADQSGTSLEALEKGILKMQRSIVDAAQGSRAAQEALEGLGLSARQLAGLAPEAQFKAIADRIAQIQDPALRAATAVRIFGRSGAEMLPLMSAGAAGIEQLQAQARKLGLTISTEDARAAEAFGDTLDILWKVIKSGVFTIGSALVPILQSVAQWMTNVARSVANWIKQNKQTIVFVFQLAAAIAGAGFALVALGAAISAVGTAMGIASAAIASLGTVLGTLGALLAALLSPIGLVIAGLVALTGYLLYATGVGGQALAWLGQRFDALKHEALASFQGIADALAAGDLSLAARILWLSLKMEWQKGIHFLTRQWTAFKEFFLSLATEAFYGAVIVLNDAFAGLQIAWVETTTFLTNAWTRFTTWLTQGWNTAVGFLQKTWARFKSWFDESLDVEAEVARIDDEVARQNRSADDQRDATLGEREQQRQSRRRQIENVRSAAEAGIVRQADAEHARRQAAHEADLEASEQALATARQEWQDAIAEAARKRKAFDDDDGGLPKLEAFDANGLLEELEGLGDAVDETEKRTVGVQGTFNAAAAQGLAAGGPSDRIAKATEDTARGVQKLVRHADHGGLVFE